jgi:hypothetical protein
MKGAKSMATEKLEQRMAQMHEACRTLALRLSELTEEDLAKSTPHSWAPTVGDFLAAIAGHSRDHLQQIARKRATLGLGPSAAQEALADVMAAQGELEGTLIGLSDEDLDQVPEGESWSVDQVLDHTAGTYGWFLSEIEKAVKA